MVDSAASWVGIYAGGLATMAAVHHGYNLINDRWAAKSVAQQGRAVLQAINELRTGIKPQEAELILAKRPTFFTEWDRFVNRMSNVINALDIEAESSGQWQRKGPAIQYIGSDLKVRLYKAKQSLQAFRADILKTTNAVRDVSVVSEVDIPQWDTASKLEAGYIRSEREVRLQLASLLSKLPDLAPTLPPMASEPPMQIPPEFLEGDSA
ncbi:uncharacterized protein LAESUDRAFT_808588 [Laetiporus sulphureus 93-53]|uniref:Fungal N-terminal domain-containing protein n=1 Tax=Laetiporus sulphureus 93-53 TaxID=1314785 RepID=A0A165IIJ0_9APHY|nr:uncharacterized protein LAESUDRAFT_808588 [Laetiporus sulphureus 93-53]KZT13123.1 hypothetical protein LAESUDRAFT_808588 [Laetiporus sulphureus 93-53]